MPTNTGRVTEVRLHNGGLVGGQLACPANLRPMPGQYLLAESTAPGEAGAHTLFPSGLSDGLIDIAPPFPPEWTAGQPLRLRGPHGQGFHLRPETRRVAAASFAAHPLRLLPLLDQALKQGADVSLFTETIPEGLPLAVEILPPAQLPDALKWAEFLAIDAPAALLTESAPFRLRARLGLAPRQSCPCTVEVLAAGEYPCGGMAECGVCAVHTLHGWKLACKDGPVFSFNDLEDV